MVMLKILMIVIMQFYTHKIRSTTVDKTGEITDNQSYTVGFDVKTLFLCGIIGAEDINQSVTGCANSNPAMCYL